MKAIILIIFLFLFKIVYTQCDPQGFSPSGEPCYNSITVDLYYLRLTPDAATGGIGMTGVAAAKKTKSDKKPKSLWGNKSSINYQ